jgi:hypothetical protein
MVMAHFKQVMINLIIIIGTKVSNFEKNHLIKNTFELIYQSYKCIFA